MSTDSRTETSTVTAAEVSQQPLLRTEIPGPRSRELHARRQAVIPPGVHSVVPVYIERAHGSILVDVDGNQIVDLASGIAVTSLGHNYPGVTWYQDSYALLVEGAQPASIDRPGFFTRTLNWLF